MLNEELLASTLKDYVVDDRVLGFGFELVGNDYVINVISKEKLNIPNIVGGARFKCLVFRGGLVVTNDVEQRTNYKKNWKWLYMLFVINVLLYVALLYVGLSYCR